MKVKNIVLTLAVVSLVAIPALAALDPPVLVSVTWATATIDEVDDVDVLLVDWEPVNGAAKYSVDIEGMFTYNTGGDDQYLEVGLSFGTSDRLDGGEMGDDYLNIPASDIYDALLAALADAGVDPGTVTGLELSVKVKALNAGNGNGKQNNPFSNSLPVPI